MDLTPIDKTNPVGVPEILKAGKNLFDLFHVPRKNYFDMVLTVMTHRLWLNVFDLDEELMKRYPDEYKDGTSMEEFITRKWGKKVMDYVKSLI